MSYISTLEGKLAYSDSLNLIKALKHLQDGGWKDDVILDVPGGHLIPEDEVGVINIPYGVYRNLGRNLEPIAELADDGRIIGTSNDVNWHGFIVTADGGREEYNLKEWIENNQAELINPNLPNEEPKQSDYEDESTWFDAYVEWQAECENEFRTPQM